VPHAQFVGRTFLKFHFVELQHLNGGGIMHLGSVWKGGNEFGKGGRGVRGGEI